MIKSVLPVSQENLLLWTSKNVIKIQLSKAYTLLKVG